MKLVKEYINEKFTIDSDPIHDMGIGIVHEIKEWLEKYDIKNYIINDDLTIDVNENINIQGGKNHRQGRYDDTYPKMENFPKYINFRQVKGDFIISNNNLTTLRGCPEIVLGSFACINNPLKSLKYAPKKAYSFSTYGNLIHFSADDIKKVCNAEVIN